MPERIDHNSPYWREKPEITAGLIIAKALDTYITPEEAVYFPDNIRGAIQLLVHYIEKAGDDPDLVLKQMGLFEAFSQL